MAAKGASTKVDTDLPDELVEDSGKKTDKKNKDKKKKKKGFPFVPILILLLLIGGITAVLMLNVLNLRDQYILPYLRNAPLVGSLIPTASPGPDSDPYAGMTQEDWVTQVTNLNYQIQKLQADLKAAQDQMTQDENTIAVLNGYKDLMDQYQLAKQQFDSMIANGDPNAYAQFYASIAPENAEWLYQQVVAGSQYTAEEKKNASYFANMSPDVAAAALQQMLTTNSDLVVSIIKNMDSTQAADIFSEMDPANVAVIMRLLAPTDTPVIRMPTAPPLATPSPVPIATPSPVPIPEDQTTEATGTNETGDTADQEATEPPTP